ncbi:MAG TPA: DUF2207 domain-containing protein [Thermoanaerobaculia bacterium]|jgi:uncharacterized membrane protein YgcG
MRIRAVLVATLLIAATAQAKSLYWPSIHVDAHLDGDGRMHVVETQTFMFDGDWNGGERAFEVYGNQSLDFEKLTRVDRDGSETTLIMAPLDKVDRYQILPGPKVRWRSRLTTDPPFRNTMLTYRLRYTLSGIVRRVNQHYVLSHDFAFPNRLPGQVIQNFSVHFTIDPIWSGAHTPFDGRATNLTPGRGYVVNASLEYHGSRAPVAVPYGASSAVAWQFAILLIIGVGVLIFGFVAGERARGRFVFTPYEEIDEQWLRDNVLRYKPEIVGAAFDNKIGAPEVAGILAALAKEKKIATRVEQRRMKRPLLHMTLLVPLEEIEGYRRTLLKRLFFKGNETDTDSIRKHYEHTGFEPAALIEKGIEGELSGWSKWTEKCTPFDWKLDVTLLIVGIILFSFLGRGGNDGALTGECIFFGVIALVGGLIAAHLNSRAVTSITPRFILVGAFMVPLLFATFRYITAAPDLAIHTHELVLAAFWSLAVVKIILDKLRIDESSERIATRMRFESARRYFRDQLATPNPKIHDDWFPYLMAFGLGSNCDSWFRTHGCPASPATSSFGSSSGSSGSSESAASAWSGGGGAFGGAGASASWAVAAGGIASGVASPSSGGSGGGGGGGGSSSGGGGGGGW